MTGVLSTGISVPGSVSYDDIGRVILSDIEGMTEVQYNVTGFPSYIGQADGGYVHNTYAGGVRLASRRTAPDGKVTTMNYEGNEVWENGKLRMLLFDGGYVDFSGNLPKYCWYTKDHLGSVRAVADADGNVFATYAYSAYGESAGMGQSVLDSVDNPYKWSGKEWDEQQAAYDFGARMYSAVNLRKLGTPDWAMIERNFNEFRKQVPVNGQAYEYDWGQIEASCSDYHNIPGLLDIQASIRLKDGRKTVYRYLIITD